MLHLSGQKVSITNSAKYTALCHTYRTGTTLDEVCFAIHQPVANNKRGEYHVSTVLISYVNNNNNIL